MANNMANVWTQMGYTPPHGPCNFKQSIVSPRCPCLRFMLHPLKSSSSYECDGCTHHASFHSMENKAEDEIRKKWEQEARDKEGREQEAAQRPKKRPRAIEYRNIADDVTNDLGPGGLLNRTTERNRNNMKTRRDAAKTRQAASMRATSKIAELTEGEEDVLELA